MINTISATTTESIEYNSNQDYNRRTKKMPAKHTNCNKADCYISSNTTHNLKHGLKSKDVVYVKPTKILWGLITLRDGFYSYTCNGKETIGDIKRKFGIPDRAIFRHTRIHDDNYIPEMGKEIAFDYKNE